MCKWGKKREKSQLSRSKVLRVCQKFFSIQLRNIAKVGKVAVTQRPWKSIESRTQKSENYFNINKDASFAFGDSQSRIKRRRDKISGVILHARTVTRDRCNVHVIEQRTNSSSLIFLHSLLPLRRVLIHTLTSYQEATKKMNSRASRIDNGNVKAAMSKLAGETVEGDSRSYSYSRTYTLSCVAREYVSRLSPFIFDFPVSCFSSFFCAEKKRFSPINPVRRCVRKHTHHHSARLFPIHFAFFGGRAAHVLVLKKFFPPSWLDPVSSGTACFFMTLR